MTLTFNDDQENELKSRRATKRLERECHFLQETPYNKLDTHGAKKNAILKEN